MRPARPRLLAATLLAGALVAWIAVGGLPGGFLDPTSAAAAPVTYNCVAVPAASPSASATPSPSPSPASLCVSVQGVQDSVSPGDTSYWNVQVWAQGAVPSASVALSVDQAGLAASFSGYCPGGNGTASCHVGDLGIGSAPAMYQMQAQIPIPSGTANISSLTLTATASAVTTPAMSSNPQAAQSMTVTTPAPSASPTPASSPTSSSPAPSATPAASASRSGASSSSTSPAHSSGPGSSAGPPTMPGSAPPTVPLGPMPAATVGPASELLFPSGSIDGLLPPITASPSGSSPGTTPAADVQALPVISSDSADSNRSTLGMSVSSAQAVGLIFLVLALALAATRLVRKQPVKGTPTGPGVGKRVRSVTRREWHRPHLPRPRRNTGDGPGTT